MRVPRPIADASSGRVLTMTRIAELDPGERAAYARLVMAPSRPQAEVAGVTRRQDPSAGAGGPADDGD